MEAHREERRAVDRPQRTQAGCFPLSANSRTGRLIENRQGPERLRADADGEGVAESPAVSMPITGSPQRPAAAPPAAIPTLQQAPRDPDFRALFRAADGCKLVGGDFSGMELRAMAAISGDRAMTEAFRAGKDLHKITAGRMLGKPEDAITKKNGKPRRRSISARFSASVLQVWSRRHGINTTSS